MQDLLTKLSTLGIQLNPNQDNLEIIDSQDKITEDLLQQIKRYKVELLELLLVPTTTLGNRKIEPATPKAFYPLSHAQERMFFLYQTNPDSLVYNMPYAATLKGSLDITKLEWAFNKLVERHESLRTHIEVNESGQVQIVSDHKPFHIDCVSLLENELSKSIRNSVKPFDLSKGPLFRAKIFTLTNKEYVLMLDMHHIICDGLSQDILISDLMNLYHNESLSPVPLQYKDYAEWQRSKNGVKDILKDKEFWVSQFETGYEVLDLPVDYRNNRSSGAKGHTIEFIVGADETEKLRDIGRVHGVTLYMQLLTIFNILVGRLSNQKDVIVGTPVAGRGHADLENTVGMFVNTLALRNCPKDSMTYLEFLKSVQKNAIACFDHQYYPFETLVNELSIKREIGRNPLFDTMFVYQNLGAKQLEILGLTVNPYKIERQVATFDLALLCGEESNQVTMTFEYSTALFEVKTIEKFVGYFNNIVKAVLNDPLIKLSDIELLSEQEQKVLLYKFNDKVGHYPKHLSVIDLFEQEVIDNPNGFAVVFNEVRVTYKELNSKANQIASIISERLTGRQNRVAILSEGSIDSIASIIGVLKSGNTYVPLSPNLPADRINFILEDSDSTLMLMDGRGSDIMAAGMSEENVIDVSSIESSDVSSIYMRQPVSESDIIYVIYTSGSTGVPKGVEVKHGGISNMVHCFKQIFHVHRGNVMSQVANFGFDAAAFEIFPCLVHGGCLNIADSDVRIDPARMKAWLIEQEVIITFQPTALAERLLSTTWLQSGKLKIMNVAGDKLSLASQSSVPFQVFNLYGPTEDSIWTTTKPLGNLGAHVNGSLIGLPIANKKVLITNGVGMLQPVNVPGELCITGDGLAKGYLKKDKLTNEKFVHSKYETGTLMYRTGDLAKRLPSGEIEFLGRIDDQVKIRGFRIELGEVENQLIQIPGIKEAAVQAFEKGGQKMLAGYYTCASNLDSSDIRKQLSKRLPEYMIPTYLVALKEFPMTPNGKINRKALPAADISEEIEKQRSMSVTERKLVRIWSDILNIRENAIGLDKSFFELGGQSLLVGTLVNKISQVFGITVSIKVVFDHQSISQLAEYLETQDNSQYENIKRAPKKEYYHVSSAQKRMFFLYEFDRDSVAYNMPNAVIVKGKLDLEKLKHVFALLIDRHESLRTQIELVNGEIVQRILSSVDFNICIQRARRSDLDRYFKSFVKPFDLSRAPLIRAEVLALDDDDHVLMIDMHHIVCDGVSFDLLLKDFMSYYEEKVPATLAIQYTDYAEWLQSRSHKEKVLSQKNFWLDEFSDLPDPLELPTDFVRPSISDFSGGEIDFEIGAYETGKLKEISSSHQSTIFMTLLAAFNVYLSRLSNQDDIVVGTSTAGREHFDLEKIIGMFTNTVPIRNKLDRSDTFSEFLKKVRDKVLSCFENQSYQYEDLIEQLKIGRDTARNPLFDVTFDLNNFDEGKLSLPDLSLEPHKAYYDSSQFDFSLTAVESDDKILMNLRYATSLFKTETILKFVQYFQNTISEIIRDVNMPISDIILLGEDERNLLLHDFNRSFRAYPNGETFPDLFVKSAEQYHDRIALSDANEELSYKELDRLSNRIARFLRSKNCEKGQVIPLVLPRGVALIACMLGVQKAGYVFVAIDIAHPLSRVSSIIEDSHAKLVITSASYAQLLKQSYGKLDYEVEGLEEKGASVNLFCNYSSDSVQTTLSADDITYMIYTSGSTGKPKAALLHQRGMVNHFRGLIDLIDINERDCLAQTAECSFDIFIVQALLCLMIGGRTVVVPKESMLDAAKFSTLIDKRGITIIELVPTVLKFLLEDKGFNCKGDTLRWLISCGEKLSQNLSQNWYSRYPTTTIVNAYGPAEASDDVTAYVVPRDVKSKDNHHVPVGKPLPNVTMYILDSSLRLCPIGVKGEICISGVAVGKGYWRNEEQTRKKFVPNPYICEVGYEHAIVYRTGDTGYWQEDGNIVFLGRMDSMIKVRGARIEPGEVESAVLKIMNVEQVVIMLKETKLCCYYVSSTGEEIPGIRDQLKDLLPDYMMPGYFVHLRSMPLTGNGKIDRRSLPDPDPTLINGSDAPVSELEYQLVQIWSDTLGVEPANISVLKSFFELGGHSLKAVVVLNKINTELKVRLRLKDLFVKDTIRSLAKLIELNNWILSDKVGDLEGQELII